MSSIILPRRFKEKPATIASIDKSILAPKSIYYPFTPGAPTVDQFNGTVGSLSGSCRANPYGIVTASGDYLTGNSVRPLYKGSTFTAIFEVTLNTLSGTHSAIIGTSGDQFLQFEVWDNGGGVVGVVCNLYIAGSYRNSPNLGFVSAINNTVRIGFAVAWQQPYFKLYAKVFSSGVIASNTSNAYGAPLDDRGGGLLFGKNHAGTQPFNGSIRYFLATEKYLSQDEIVRIFDDPWQIFKRRPQVLYFDVGGGGTQTLTPSLFTNTNTFYSPTVGRGAVTLTPSLFTSATNAFYSATVTQGGATQTLTPALFSNSQSFFSATVTPGGVSLAPPLLTNGQTFYAPTVTPGSVTLTPSLFASSTNAFYAPTVTQEGGPQYLTAPLVSNTSAFYAPTVTPGAITITPDLFANAQTFYAATVSQGAPGQTLEPELLVSTNQFFTAIVTVGGVTLTPSLFTNSNTFYAHLLTGGDTVNAILSAPRSAGRQIQTGIRSNIQNTRR